MISRSVPKNSNRWLAAFQDKEYIQKIYRLALPITLQQLVWSGLNMVGLVMVGQLGEVPIAAVGLSNQVWFLLALILFGINSGSAMFTAQYWGRDERLAIRKVLGIALALDVAVSILFMGVTFFIPHLVLRIFSTDPAVVAVGSQYLQIYGFSFIFAAIAFGYAAVLRSTGEVRIPIIINMGALSLNALLSYLLIFGVLGFPRLGVQGAALSIVIARSMECAALLFITYRRSLPAAVTLSDVRLIRLPFVTMLMKPITPVILNELLWALGITAYNVVYARIGTDSIAAMNIVSTIENVAMVVFIGLGNATAILVGNNIGAGDREKAYRYAGRSLALGAVGGLLVGGLILLGSGFILQLYKVPPEVIFNAQRALLVLALLLWLRATNIILFIGVFRAGGDTRLAFILDAVIIWVVGVPLAFIGAFVLRLPVYWVYLLVLTEELIKCCIGIWRYLSRRWIHDLSTVTG